jgi:hypothetical protein
MLYNIGPEIRIKNQPNGAEGELAFRCNRRRWETINPDVE